MPQYNPEGVLDNKDNDTDFGRPIGSIEEETEQIAGIQESDKELVRKTCQRMEEERQEKEYKEYRERHY
jgi:hypothetical protein